MRTLALLFALPATLAYAQTTPSPAPDAAAAAQPAAEQTASPELVGQLAKDLAITPQQAQGAAATLFGVAKGKLTPTDFGKVADAVPNMDALLKAAPAPDAKAAALTALAGSAGGGVGTMASAVSTMSKLGLKPETIAKVAPALVKLVQAKGGAEVGTLLAGALK